MYTGSAEGIDDGLDRVRRPPFILCKQEPGKKQSYCGGSLRLPAQ